MRKSKIITCLFLSAILAGNTPVYSYASTSKTMYMISSDTYVFDLEENSVKEFILSLGVTEKEYNAILNDLEQEFEKQARIKPFPSNPVEGQEFVQDEIDCKTGNITYTIYVRKSTKRL